MNNKGFTLVELLAMLAVLAILMGVAIPNITGILKNQKKNTFKNDAVTLVETAKTKIARDELISKPKVQNDCIVFSLNYLNDNDNVITGPNGGKYNEYESFVIVKKACTAGAGCEYKYYVRLIEEVGEGSSKYYFGVSTPTDINDINKPDSQVVKKISGYHEYGLTETGTNANTLNSQSEVKNSTLCPNPITSYYQRKRRKCEYYQGVYFDDKGEVVKENICAERCGKSCK